MKKKILSVAISTLLCGGINVAHSATYQDTSAGGVISLDNVAIDDSANAASAVLTALDGGSLHGGQIYRLASSGVSIGNQDGRYTSIDGKAIIPALVQNEFLRYNVTMLQTKFTPEQEFTVIELTTSTFSDGAAVEIVFNQGPKGDAGSAGTQGATGATGLKGDAGLTGLTGPQGTVGATGAAGSQGSTGSTGSAGTNGTNGTNGYSVLSGAGVASGGVNGDFYIDTAANTISGPKAGGNWPTVVSLIGPTGPQGDDGADGTPGTGAPVHAIGEQYAGGIVFWVDASGQHGLIAAKADSATVTWRNAADKVTGTSGDGLYAGAMNTAMIVSAQIADGLTSFAALVAANYSIRADGIIACTGHASESCYGDWYLPSKAELNLLYNQKAVVTGFANATYWSSTEYDAGNAWYQYFGDGFQGGGGKDSSLRVRAVRAF